MRYAGEWKFAGGAVDTDESLLDAAKRELQEEFCFTLPGVMVMAMDRVTVRGLNPNTIPNPNPNPDPNHNPNPNPNPNPGPNPNPSPNP